MIITGGIIWVAYLLASKIYKKYMKAVIGIYLTFAVMFIVPAPVQLFLFILLMILMISIIFTTFMPRFFTNEQDKLLIDKPPSKWEQFEHPPELKEQKEVKA